MRHEGVNKRTKRDIILRSVANVFVLRKVMSPINYSLLLSEIVTSVNYEDAELDPATKINMIEQYIINDKLFGYCL